MKRILPVLFSLFPMVAFADSGDHSNFTLSGVLHHVLGEPDHAGIDVAVVLVTAIWLTMRRAQK